MDISVLTLKALPLLFGGPAPQGSGGGLSSLIMFVPLIAIFYFLILRPQKKRQQETQKMLSGVKKGDKVVSIGGIHGIIQSVKENSVIVKVDENVKIELNRSAIASVTSREDRDEKEEKKIEASGDDSSAAKDAEGKTE